MKKTIFFLCLSFSFVLNAQSILINELMSKNTSTYIDNEGNTPDWIELFNNESFDVDLEGYKISDQDSLDKSWVFPPLILNGKSYLLLLASSKDKAVIVNHWETIVDWGDTWKYKAGQASITGNWKNPDYDDTSWGNGASGFGFGDNDDKTVLPSSSISVFARKSFYIQDTNNVKSVIFNIDFDDGFAAYLNGHEIARANLGNVGEDVPYNKFTTAQHEAVMYNGGKPDLFVVKDIKGLLKQGNNVLAVQVHNVSSSSSDLTMIPFLTLGYAVEPSGSRGESQYIEVPEFELHTDFSLSSGGETINLWNNNDQLVDSLTLPELSPDISYGRNINDKSSCLFYNIPTPGAANTSNGFSDKNSKPRFITEGGFYTNSVQVTIEKDDETAVIYYTKDGSEPSKTSLKYSGPFTLTKTTVIRAAAISNDALPSEIATTTYFINAKHVLPVFSIITDPVNLWDYNEGIYVKGPNAESSYPYFNANFWQDWERVGFIQMYEKDKSLAFEMNLGLKIYGGWSRAIEQKSLALFARKIYGSSKIEHKLFPNLPFTEYESFILRNSANDWQYTMFRDAFMQSLVSSLNLDILAYRPSVVYINGEYWGIENVREKVNENYLATHHNVDPNKIDLLTNKDEVLEGSNLVYNQLLNYIETHNLSNNEYYSEVVKRVDINNFIDYMTSQIFFDNQDWPGNNIKFWRPQTENGRWRWILYDTDFGFGLYNSSSYTFNTLQFALAANGSDWPNPPWSTFLLRNLLKNARFKNLFLNRFADLSNTIFQSSHISSLIDSLKNDIASEIPNHISRWNSMNYTQWNNNIEVMKRFGQLRTTHMWSHYMQQFSISKSIGVKIQINNPEFGSVKLNTIEINKDNWTGSYFYGNQITLVALPKNGYKFIGWESDIQSSEDTLRVVPTTNVSLKAVFEKSDEQINLIINEINYNSSPDFNSGDWVELYNNSEIPVNIKDWLLKDDNDNNSFSIKQNIMLDPHSFIVLCSDTSAFRSVLTDKIRITGDFEFGLSNGGDQVRLFNPDAILSDSVEFDDESPWNTEPDGTGKTLSLINPDSDNNLYSNWTSSLSNGTPGRINDVAVAVNETVEIITSFSLEQNYPNPFNPATTIIYSIPADLKDGNRGNSVITKLIVYDILGREVSTLVNEVQSSGKYKVEFNASGLASGVYMYRLNAGKYNQARKMIITK